MSNFSHQFSFSISESILWLIVLLGVPFVINRIKKKRMEISRIFLNLITTIAVFYVWFYLFWGINYLRPPLQEKLRLKEVQVPIDAFDSTFVQIIDQSNQLNLAYSIKQIAHIDSTIDSSYEEVLRDLGLPRVPGYRGLKTITANWLLNKTTTSGWFSPFFHEVHFNSDLLIYELPFVIAHEKAHQMGYTSEADCNFLAHLVCINTSEPLCQYSGYFQILGYFLRNAQHNNPNFDYYINQFAEGVKLDLEAVSERWKSHRGFISDISNKGYDLYLKANDVKEGIQNYSKVVGMIVRYNAQKKINNQMK